MSADSNTSPPPLEQYRSYLLLLARLQLEGPWRHQVDASDVVQQTLMEAHQRPVSAESGEQVAWLRRALANNIRDALRHLRRQKRDIRRQQSLDAAWQQSSPELVERQRHRSTGQLLATAARDGSVRLWDLTTGQTRPNSPIFVHYRTVSPSVRTDGGWRSPISSTWMANYASMTYRDESSPGANGPRPRRPRRQAARGRQP